MAKLKVDDEWGRRVEERELFFLPITDESKDVN